MRLVEREPIQLPAAKSERLVSLDELGVIVADRVGQNRRWVTAL